MEIYNTGTTTIDISNWQIWVDGAWLYTYLEGTTIAPGEIILVTDLNTEKGEFFELVDSSDPPISIDSKLVDSWQVKSFGRIGTPDDEYATWVWMDPTPGEINEGQVPIPEFGDVVVPVSIVTIMFFAIMRRRRAANGNAASDDIIEGETHGSNESGDG